MAFLKIDVEGFELPALASAGPLFAAKRVAHALIEFGPPKRWADAGLSQADGLNTLSTLTKDYGLEPRMVQCYAWNAVFDSANTDHSFASYMEALRSKQTPGTYLPLADEGLWPAFMEGMSSCNHCEAELWLTLPLETNAQTYDTFGSMRACVRGDADSPKKHRKPCFVHDLGDGEKSEPYEDAPTKAGMA